MEKHFGALKFSQDVYVFLDHPSIFHGMKNVNVATFCSGNLAVAANPFKICSPTDAFTWRIPDLAKTTRFPATAFWATAEFPRLCIHYWSHFTAFLQRRHYCPNSRAGKRKAQKLSHFPMNVQLGSGFQSSFGWFQDSRLWFHSFLFPTFVQCTFIQFSFTSTYLHQLFQQAFTQWVAKVAPRSMCMHQSHLWVIEDREAENW